MTARFDIRRAEPYEADAVRDLTRQSYSRWIPVIGREPRPMTADYDSAIVRHRIDVIADGARLIALIEMVPEANHLLVENIAVREDRQGHGIGSLLLAHAECVARSMGKPEVRLYTNAAFAANLAFYAARGYSEAARTPLPDGGTMVHFVKSVS